jgi:hypothetical protein
VVCPFVFLLPTVYLRRFPHVSLAQNWQKRAVFEVETQDGHTGLGPIFLRYGCGGRPSVRRSRRSPLSRRGNRHAPHAADLWAEVPTGEKPSRPGARAGAALGEGTCWRRGCEPTGRNKLTQVSDRVSGLWRAKRPAQNLYLRSVTGDRGATRPARGDRTRRPGRRAMQLFSVGNRLNRLCGCYEDATSQV